MSDPRWVVAKQSRKINEIIARLSPSVVGCLRACNEQGRFCCDVIEHVAAKLPDAQALRDRNSQVLANLHNASQNAADAVSELSREYAIFLELLLKVL